ncbi:MAG: gamma-glutamyltransferase [Longimicrobiales bacterium]
MTVSRSRGSWLLIAVPMWLAACAEPSGTPTDEPPQVSDEGRHGMVASAHPLATSAGVRVLEEGGNAFDAAVAVAAALNVVEPMMSGMGGYGTILVHDAASGRTRFLNPSGRIPRAVDSDAFRAPTPGFEENRVGAKAVSTPGNANAWEAMWREYGTLEWPELFTSAISYAEAGFPISPALASAIGRAYPEFPEHARAIYGRDGEPLAVGDTLVQRDLAASLGAVAAGGAAVVHGGSVGEAVDAAMRQAGGFLSLEDLRANEAEWWEPIAIEHGGVRIVTASPPANSFDALVRVGMMGLYDVASLGHNSVRYLHRFAEVTKHGFWVRLRWAGDPDVSPPPVDELLSERYWRDQVAAIDTARASAFVYPAVASDGSPTAAGDTQDRHTTHFVVADRWGNVVSATQTLGNLFGSRIMPEGTGIWLNNSLAYSTFEPKGNPMDAHAGRRKLSGDVPVIVFRDGRPWAALGTPGGHTIGQTVPQVLLNLVDFAMPMAEAIASPRVSFLEPDQLGVESAVPEAVRDSLAALGHIVQVSRAFGNAHGLTIEYDSSGVPVHFTGAADPRGEGSAKGVR